MIQTIYSNPKFKNELYHHGIKGQRWGKRNGPPYPLDPEDHSEAEKKAMNGKKVARIVAGVAVTAGALYVATHQSQIASHLMKYSTKNLNVDALIESMGPEIVRIKDGKVVDFDDMMLSGGKQSGSQKVFETIQGEHSWSDDLSNAGSPNTYRRDCGRGSMALLERRYNNANIKARDIDRSTSWDDVKKIYPSTVKDVPRPVAPVDDVTELSSYLGSKLKEGESGLLGLWGGDSSKQQNHMIVMSKENGVVLFRDQQVTYKLPSGKTLKGLEFSADSSIVKIGGKQLNPKASKKLVNKYMKHYNLDLTTYATKSDIGDITDNETVLNEYFVRG